MSAERVPQTLNAVEKSNKASALRPSIEGRGNRSEPHLCFRDT